MLHGTNGKSNDPELARIPCPACGARGRFSPHARYARWLVRMEGGRIVEERVRVERVKCASCGRTHALMPPEAVPYSPFSLEIHFLALAMHGDADARVRDACERCGISVRTLYRIASHAAELAVALASVGSPSPARDLPAAAARCASLRRTFAVVHCAAFRRAPFQNVRSRNVTRRARQRAPVST